MNLSFELLEILGYCLKHTNCDHGIPIITMLNRLLFEKGAYTQKVRYIVDLVEQRLLHQEKGDNGFLERLLDGADEDETAFAQNVTVNKCFRFPSEFTKEKVKLLVDLYYQDSYANLALIEIALYDHGQLKKRNAHKPFVEALVAWGILDVENDEAMTLLLDSLKHKHNSLPKTDGYKSWGPEFLNEKNTCINIGDELGETAPYRYKKED